MRGIGTAVMMISGFKTTAGISLNGGFFAGIATAIELRLFNNENMKIAIEPKFGLNETGNFVIDLVDTDLFRKNKDSKIKARVRDKNWGRK